jgi:hypothetical protein
MADLPWLGLAAVALGFRLRRGRVLRRGSALGLALPDTDAGDILVCMMDATATQRQAVHLTSGKAGRSRNR